VVRVSSDTQLFRGVVQTLTISGTTPARTPLHIPSSTSRQLIRLQLLPQNGVCRVDFSISPTRRPIDFPRLRLNDSRSLGLHFDSYRYVQPKQ
jgi:hypothetical protein